MSRSRRTPVSPGARSAALAGALLALLVLVLSPALSAGPATASTAQTLTGNATHFDGLGSPYGGCGLPQSRLDSQDFVALNVYNTPGDYSSSLPRPIPASDASKTGMWDNGRNCGRWVQVTIGDYCTGTNDGAPGRPFCRNGSWISDAYNGATLTMLVADSCGDANAWCRDDPYHLDLGTASLNRFVKNGQAVGDLSAHWNNRRVQWGFVPAPGYSGDIRIGFLRSAQRYWPAIAVSHLPNGLHGVQYYAGGDWHDAQMNSDMGQSYIVAPTASGGTQYTIRVRDASDALLFGGRSYSFSLPAGCSNGCPDDYTPVGYTSQDPGSGPTPSPTPPPGQSGACAASWRVTNSWTGGFQVDVTVTNTGTNTGTGAMGGWQVGFTLPSGDAVGSAWNATVDSSARPLTARNMSYNGALPPAGSTTWGMTVSGADLQLGAMSCTAR